MGVRLSIVVPTLNEAPIIEACLSGLKPLREAGCEVIVVDGGSADATCDLADPWADRVLRSRRGRGRQMNTGARSAQGEVLLFLHADTRLPPRAERLILAGLERSGRAWGRFDVRLSGRRALFILVAACMSRRSRLTGIATGDQAVFVRRTWFEAVGGFPDIPLMEDIALSRKLKRRGPPLCLPGPVITSSRRWEANGVVRTILLMWWLRTRYYFGADPSGLAAVYQRGFSWKGY